MKLPSHTVGSEHIAIILLLSIYVTVTIPHGGLGTNPTRKPHDLLHHLSVTIPHGGLGTFVGFEEEYFAVYVCYHPTRWARNNVRVHAHLGTCNQLVHTNEKERLESRLPSHTVGSERTRIDS